MKHVLAALCLMASWVSWPGNQPAADHVKTAAGPIEGTTEAGGVRTFKGIPFAAPPVGALRWQPPQPPTAWTGVRQTTAFGPQCMQRRQFADMVFRSSGTSEDCLYLNVWAPASGAGRRLPVLVYFYGGGFTAGDGSEPRYDGAAMARRGIVALTVNYRLGVFGFLAHPELTMESSRRSSGNYGLLDQHAALQWVRDNIAAFGGDPGRVTIAGESAGSISVSAQMSSPLSKGLIAGAIGESGALINPTSPAVPLADAERAGTALAAAVGAPALAALRAMPAAELLEAAAKPGTPRPPVTIDGYFLVKAPVDVLAAGEQAHVPLLAGWNSQESGPRGVLGTAEPTPDNYSKALRAMFANRVDEALTLYPGRTTEEVQQSATDLAGDRFIAFSTWKWLDLHGRTGGNPVYRYFYSRPRPAMRPGQGTPSTGPGQAGGPARGAAHSAEIEYALGNLGTNEVYAWTPDDHKVSEIFQGYIANFVKTGNPNGPGLPSWPAANQGDQVQVLHLDVSTRVEPDRHRPRYLFLDQIYAPKPAAPARVPAMAAPVPRSPDILFRSRMIDPGASETAAVADINRDGRLDIVSGEFWYEAPSWQPHRFREIDFRQQYVDVFSDLPIDADNDGYPDIVSVSWFAKKVSWWRNPGRAVGALWREAVIHEGFNVEFALLADVDNDGKAQEIVAQENGTGQAWYEVRNGAWVGHVVSDRSYGHGIGAGDVNQDGRTDILTPRGWLEAPVDPRAPAWTFHSAWEAINVPAPAAPPAAAPAAGTPPRVLDLGFMHVLDVNGDGRNDVIAAAGHDYGVFWFEQGPDGVWTRRLIDNAWSQGHASTLADVNGDGRLDLVTGKRFMAHNGADPGEREPLGVYWYEHRAGAVTVTATTGRGSGGVEWIRHLIDFGGRVGGGMQIPVVDIDGDGDLDVICAGKSGLFLLENLTK